MAESDRRCCKLHISLVGNFNPFAFFQQDIIIVSNERTDHRIHQASLSAF